METAEHPYCERFVANGKAADVGVGPGARRAKHLATTSAAKGKESSRTALHMSYGWWNWGSASREARRDCAKLGVYRMRASSHQ